MSTFREVNPEHNAPAQCTQLCFGNSASFHSYLGFSCGKTCGWCKQALEIAQREGAWETLEFLLGEYLSRFYFYGALKCCLNAQTGQYLNFSEMFSICLPPFFLSCDSGHMAGKRQEIPLQVGMT